MTSKEFEEQGTSAQNAPCESEESQNEEVQATQPEDSAQEQVESAQSADEASAESLDAAADVSGEQAGQTADASGSGESAEEENSESSEEADESAGSEQADEHTQEEEAAGADEEKADADADAESADAPLRKRGSRAKKALIAVAAAVLIVIGGCCIALAADDSARTQMVPEKTTLDGEVDVTGMTQDELVALVDSRVEDEGKHFVTLDVNGEEYSVDLLAVGKLKTEDTVAQAYAPYNTNIFMRWGSRIAEFVTGETGSYDIYTAYEIDRDALAARVSEIANNANCDPKNAGYEYNGDTNTLVVTPPIDGVVVDNQATISAVEKSVLSPSGTASERFTVHAIATVTAPEELEPGQAIFVDTRNCVVTLYEGGVEAESYACTPGQSGYATPKGNFYLDYKDSAPTWINPHSEWSANMPETIGPGASNPLGLRALAVSCGGGIFIHGTTNTGGLGYPGSHGCIRLSNSNIVELYDRVSAGIPIIIR